MGEFRKGDILKGTFRRFEEAYHPVVYLDGPGDAPLAVVLTSSPKYPCNKLLRPEHVESGVNHDGQYFVAHRIQKLKEWGPYRRVGRLTEAGIRFIEASLPDGSMEWDQYEKYKNLACSDHPA